MEGLFWFGIFTLVFLSLDIYCVYKIIEYFKMKKHGICCDAKVIKLVKESTRAGYSYRPWFEYTTNTGKVITAICESATSFKNAFAVGKKVKIHYDNENPDKYIIDKNTLYVQLTLLFVVTVLLSCSCVMFIDLLIRVINSK